MIYSCLDPEGAVPLGGAAGPLVLAGVEVHQPLVLPPEALAHLHTHTHAAAVILPIYHRTDCQISRATLL